MGLAKNNYYGLAGNHHPDAEIISRIGNRLGWNVIRGSSTDGGKKAYDDMLRVLSCPGNVFAITPDGPKGPKEIIKDGIIKLAQTTGAPIVPLFWKVKNHKLLNSWDDFIIPFPFSKGVYIFGEPIHVKRKVTKKKSLSN